MIKIYTSYEKQHMPTHSSFVPMVDSFPFSNVTCMKNEYCIEIVYNNHRLFDFAIFTVEPWITYLILMKRYFIDGYAEVTDQSKPIVYSFSKAPNNQLHFKLYHRHKNEIKQVALPEEEFISCLFENLFKYLECLRTTRPKYFEYWLKRFEDDLSFVANQIEMNYLKV